MEIKYGLNLIDSFDPNSDWLEKVKRRAEALDNGAVKTVLVEGVMAETRVLLKSIKVS